MRGITRRTEIRIETHEIKIIRFGKRRDDEKDNNAARASLITEPASGCHVTELGELVLEGSKTRKKKLASDSLKKL